MTIIYEDDEILVVKKPAGISTEAGKVSERDMVSEVNNYLYKCLRRAGKSVSPGYLIHRLDKPVEGILVFAKTKSAAADLNKQIKEKKFNKCYYALVCSDACNCNEKEIGKPITSKYEENQNIIADSDDENRLINYIRKDNRLNKAVICSEEEFQRSAKSGDKNGNDIKKAELIYKVEKNPDVKSLFECVDDNTILLNIKLITGRFHQIRAQLSNLGYPILGDTLYGGKAVEKRNYICLKAYKLEFIHPKTHKQMTFDIT